MVQSRYSCKECGHAIFSSESKGVAQLHVALFHSNNFDSCIEINHDEPPAGKESAKIADRKVPQIHQRLSTLLLEITLEAIKVSSQDKLCRDSYTLLSELEKFVSKTENLARVLAESDSFLARLLQILDSAGTIQQNRISQAYSDDRGDIIELMRTLLESRGHRKDIDALADNSHLSEAFLELIEEILDDIRYRHSSTSEEAEDSILPTEDATFRSRLRRASIHLAKVSNCMPPSLYLTVVVLEHPECLTGGGFADIYQGKHNDQLVAVKRLRVFLYQSPKDRARTSKLFRREALMWKHLDHPNILKFLGINSTLFTGPSPCLCMVSPWMEKGNVHDFRKSKSNGMFSETEVFEALTGIASGLAYLHRERIVHGDLRGPNILVDDEGHMLLADFGLADFGDSTSSPTTSTQPGAAAWQAPELLDPETFGLSSSHVTYESDIFAFSSVCWEIHVGLPPFHPLKGLQISSKIVVGTRALRESSNRDVPDALWSLICSCWEHRPQSRPTARMLLGALQSASSSGAYDTVLSMDQDLSPIHDGISVGSPAFISQSSLASMSAGVPSMLSAGNSTPSLTLSVRSSVHFAATPSFGAGRSNLSREMPSLRLLSPSGSYAYRRRGGSQNGSGYSTEPSGTLNSQTLIDERTDSHYSLSLSEGNSLAPIEETNLQVPVNGPKNKRQSAMQGMRRWAQKILPIRHSSSNTTPNSIPGNEGGAVGGFSANKRDRTLTRKGAKAVPAKIKSN